MQQEGDANEVELLAFRFLKECDEFYPTKCVARVLMADQFVAHLMAESKKLRSRLEELSPPAKVWLVLFANRVSLSSVCNLSSAGALLDRVRVLYYLCVENFPEARELLKNIVVSAFVAARIVVREMPMQHRACQECYRLHPEWTAEFISQPDEIAAEKN